MALPGVLMTSQAVQDRRVLAFLIALVSGCGHLLEDNGTHLAFVLERGVKELRASSATEIVVRYETLDGPNQNYYVEITPSFGESGQETNVWSSYLVVSGKTSGGTSYHNRFVFVPKRLYIEKKNGATELVLRKEGDRISVVEVR